MRLRSVLIFAFLAALTAPSYADPTAAGLWALKDSDGFTTSWFLFAEKNNVYSGRIVKAFKKPGDTSPVIETCEKCPGDKKGARFMGLTLFWGMKRDGLRFTGGSALDPRDGKVYTATMTLNEDGKELKVRGYVLGMEWMGKDIVFYRLPDDAMKKEDIPKEVLVGGAVEDSSADKPKPKKPKPLKPAAAEVASPDATTEATPK